MSCPDHYKLTTLFCKDGSPAEVIDICDEIAPSDPNHFQAIEYLLRAKRKGQYLSDLEKCKFYVQRMIDKENNSNDFSDIETIDEDKCTTCKHETVNIFSNPCNHCGDNCDYDLWEPKP